MFLTVLALLGMLVAPWLVALFAPGFDPQKAALTVTLARIMYPFIVLVSLAAVVMGLLNAHATSSACRRWPRASSTSGSIVGGVILGYWLDPHFGPRAVIGLAIGTLIGGALQLAVQLPSLRRVGYHVPSRTSAGATAGIRDMLRLMGPSVIAASSTQVNVLVNSMFASTLGDGPIFWLDIAFRLMQLPLGLFGVALGTVTLPLLARVAATGDLATFRRELARGMRLSPPDDPGHARADAAGRADHLGALPARALHGADTAQAAGALRFYAIGLSGYAALKVLVNAFYALDRRHTPMVISFIAVGVNLVLNWIFTFRLGWGHRGLAFSTGCIATINFLVLYVLMHRQLGTLHTQRLAATLGQVLAGRAAAGGGVLVGDRTGCWPIGRTAFPAEARGLLTTILAAAAVRSSACAAAAHRRRRRHRRRRAPATAAPFGALALSRFNAGLRRGSVSTPRRINALHC